LCEKVCKSVAKCVKSLYILMMFGFNTPSIDSKGRIAIPARYRIDFKTQNQNVIIITKDPQYPSLKLYSHSEWQRISSKLQSLQGLDPVVRNLQWTILGNAYQTEIDIEGRMLLRIPIDLQNYAEIKEQKQIALVGMGNKFEIWNIKNWEMRQTGGSLSTEILDVVLPESIKEMSF
jgi:MraZ protein